MNGDELERLLFGSKTCTLCHRSLPASSEFFARDRHELGRLTHDCRDCRNARDRRSKARRKAALRRGT